MSNFSISSAKTIRVGDFSFSDELGGFELVSVSGSGEKNDPFVVTERMTDLSGGTIVIRFFERTQHEKFTPARYWFRIAVKTIVINDTGQPWTGYDLELQSILGKASDYRDGLSFDQPGDRSKLVSVADLFESAQWLAEPYDRIEFRAGTVDVASKLTVQFNITDATPGAKFYLKQQPVLSLASNSPMKNFADATDIYSKSSETRIFSIFEIR